MALAPVSNPTTIIEVANAALLPNNVVPANEVPVNDLPTNVCESAVPVNGTLATVLFSPTPPVTPPQGTSGGTSGNTGGGAIAQGPGNGASSAITGSPITYSSGSFPSGTGRGGTKEGDNIAGGAGSGGQVIIRYRFQ